MRAMSIGRLEAIFQRSERALAHGVPIRKTSAGIWVPSPIPMIAAAVSSLKELGLLGPEAAGRTVLDAGMGDGRVAAVVAALEPSHAVYGIERDPVLYARAAQNLRRVLRIARGRPRVQPVEGDYCDVATYASCGLDLQTVGVVVNYPDGNQERLARFIAAHAGPGASLCLFTHDRALRIDDLVLRAERDLPAEYGPDWRLAVYRGRPGASSLR